MSETLQQVVLKKMRKFSSRLKNMTAVEGNLENESLNVEITYHPDGKVEKELRYQSNGNVEEEHEYIYDSSGRIVLHNWSMPMDEVEQSERTERDEQGKVIREVKLYYGEEGESSNYLYDEKGRILGVKFCDEEGTLIQEEHLIYNDLDKIIQRKVTDHAAGNNSETHYIYNEKGQLVGQSELNEKGELVSRTVIEHDENGNDISLIQYNPKNEVTQRVVNTYDDQGRIIHRLASGSFTRIYTYEYDEAGRLIDESTTDENNTLISRSSFHFDEAGRLINETAYEMDLTHSGRDMAMAYRYEYEILNSKF